MVKNLPANAALIPDPGRSHMPRSNEAHEPQLLSLCSRAQELQLLKPQCPQASALLQKRPPQWILQLEKSLTALKTQYSQKIKVNVICMSIQIVFISWAIFYWGCWFLIFYSIIVVDLSILGKLALCYMRCRHPGEWSQVSLRKHFYEQS